MRVILNICCQIERPTAGFCYVNSGPFQILCNSSIPYLGLSIQLNVSPIPLEICRPLDESCTPLDESCTPLLLPNTAHVILFTLCQLWSRSSRTLSQICIYGHEYSIERTSVSIRDMPTIRCALHPTFRASYSVSQPACSMSAPGPDISSVVTV
jgi:hypothetical protein